VPKVVFALITYPTLSFDSQLIARLYDGSGDDKHCHKTTWGWTVLPYSVIAWGILWCSRRDGSGVAMQATAMRRHLLTYFCSIAFAGLRYFLDF